MFLALLQHNSLSAHRTHTHMNHHHHHCNRIHSRFRRASRMLVGLWCFGIAAGFTVVYLRCVRARLVSSRVCVVASASSRRDENVWRWFREEVAFGKH